MVYLYAALGVVMMTGIMAVVEMGLSLTGQSTFFKSLSLLSSSQKESINELKRLDQNVLLLLSNIPKFPIFPIFLPLRIRYNPEEKEREREREKTKKKGF